MRIGQRRREAGLSRRALGELVGIGLKQINKYETAVNRVSAGRLFDIAAALGVPPTYFFDGIKDSGPGGGDRQAHFADAHPTGSRREVRTLVDSYHSLAPDIRSRFLRLVRTIADNS
ncbi:MAG: helix-turn-helix domain-containing protein [Alphaproteobacteria bacterium]|nr:helix-turn-helix domain-containing protein [Alphaproteobacteria bacterium]